MLANSTDLNIEHWLAEHRIIDSLLRVQYFVDADPANGCTELSDDISA